MTIVAVEMVGVVAMIVVRILTRVMMRFIKADRGTRNWGCININNPEEVTSQKDFSLMRLCFHKPGNTP